MKVVGLVPFWFGKNDGRDLKKLAGRYLIEYTVELLSNIESINSTVVYSSNKEIMKYINEDFGITHLKRAEHLDNENILVEEIIDQFFNDYVEADIIVLMHPLCPFIQRTTLEKCIELVRNGKYDSAFTALEYQKFAWFKNDPLNFDKKQYSPKLKSLDKVVIEQGLTYIISKKAFMENKNRIGKNPYIKIINHFEGHEINDVKDFEIAELIVNSGMYQGA